MMQKPYTEIISIPIRGKMAYMVVAIPNSLSKTEKHIFKEILNERPLKQIAKEANRHIKTLHTHKRAIYEKLSIQSDISFYRDLIVQGIVKIVDMKVQEKSACETK